jgi:trk system potassium uptake protein
VRQRVLDHPTRLVPLAFLGAISLGTLVLMLPAAQASGQGAPFLTALFTATSAICVTGLAIVDTPTYWSLFGQVVILVLIQVGGLGITVLASLLGLLISRRMRLKHRLIAQAETRSLDLGDVKALLVLIVTVTFAIEALLAGWLALCLHLTYDFAPGPALWHGVFHAVAAYTNAGFSTLPNGIIDFADDPLVLGPLMLGVIIGGIGFPVLHELKREGFQPKLWSTHARLTLYGSAGLLGIGFVAFTLMEWSNPDTFGPMPVGTKLLSGALHSVMTRSGGLSSFDTGLMHHESLLLSSAFMFIGGGSASAAGGIKVTTFLVLAFAVWAEIAGQNDVTVAKRRIGPQAVRQALAVAFMALGVIGLATITILGMTSHALEYVLFEVVSAFANVGLSTGIIPDLPSGAQYILTFLMFLGRVGTVTIAAGLALRPRAAPYRYPEERPIIG